MQRFILANLPILLVTAAVSATMPTKLLTSVAKAQEITAIISTPLKRTSIQQLTPFALVALAMQGYFQSQGIPPHLALMSSYQMRRVTATNLVQAAVIANRLDPAFLNDQGYLNAVELQLQVFANVH
jgi:hypothetical protein